MQDLQDEILMEKYQRGEAGAMDVLLARYKNPLFRFAWRMCKSQSQAEEVAQEVFLKVHQHRASYRPGASVRTWFFSICHNLCVSRLRRGWREVLMPRREDDEGNEITVDVVSNEPSPFDEAAQSDAAQLVKKCLHRLPFLQREALVLREYEQLNYREIAHILKKPEGTVKTLIFRARASLQEMMLPYVKEMQGRVR